MVQWGDCRTLELCLSMRLSLSSNVAEKVILGNEMDQFPTWVKIVVSGSRKGEIL